MTTIAVSCVVDRDPRFRQQVLRFIASLDAADPARRLARVVHHVGPLPDALRAWLVAREVILGEIPAFGSGAAAYCNKLQAFDPLIALAPDHVILCDADLFFLASPDRLVGNAVRAGRVGGPNPAAGVVRALLDAAGFAAESVTARPRFKEGQTHRLNCNGGLYVMPLSHLRTLSPVWRKWARFCLGRADILGSSLFHADQLGFMLAMLETGLEFESLPAHANFPTQLAFDPDMAVPDGLSSLHYHRNVEEGGALRLTGHVSLDRSIGKANAVLRSAGVLSTIRDMALEANPSAGTQVALA